MPKPQAVLVAPCARFSASYSFLVNEHLVFGSFASMVSIEPDLPGFEGKKKITGAVELGGRFESGNVIDCVR